MGKLADKVRRWWGGDPRRSGVPVPFQVACTCGQFHQGLRAARHQVLRCPGCGQSVFVLPFSPFPLLDGGVKAGLPTPAPSAKPSTAHPWRLPVIAGAVTLLAVVVFFLVLFKLLERQTPAGPAVGSKEVLELIAAGEKALAEDNVILAAQKFEAAQRLRDQAAGSLGGAQWRRLQQLSRQTDLLDRLLDQPLQVLVAEAAAQRDMEAWQPRFDRHYRGKSVILDAWVSRDAAGHYDLSYRLPAIELDDLKLLHRLPLERPHRLLFGARLASVAPEQGRGWAIRFEPDSGVLVTDLGVAEACCREILDEELKEVVQRQAEWAAGMP